MINKFLLAGDKFMRETHLRKLGFTYSVSGPFTKNKAFRDKAFDIAKDTKMTDINVALLQLHINFLIK